MESRSVLKPAGGPKVRNGLPLIATLLMACGCVSGGVERAASVLPGGGGGNVASSIIDEMNGGLVAGATLNQGERRQALEAEYRALEYMPAGEAVRWRNTAGTRSGEVTAAQPYRVGSQDCRQYTHALSVDGQRRALRGTACRNPDGSWSPLT
jgi:surface antigen